MIRALLFLAVMIGLAGNGHAQITSFPEKPELLAAFVPENVAEEGGYIGGEIVFKLRLVSKRPFESLDFKLPAQIEGADLRQLVRPRTRRLRSYTGRGYVFEAIYGIYPHTSGTLKLPSLQASGTVPGSQPGGTNEPFIASLPATELRIHQQASAMESDWWMVSPQVTVSETLSKPEAEVRQGDIIRRHVTISAVGVPAERMPIPEHGHGRGHSILLVDQQTETKVTETGVVGTVRMTWDLEIGQEGVVYISPIPVAYWHPVERRRMTTAAPGKRWEPLPLDRTAKAALLLQEAADTQNQWQAAAVAGASLPTSILLLLIGWFVWQTIPSSADRRLKLACKSTNDPRLLLKAIGVWEDETNMTADGLAEVHLLEKAVFGDALEAPAGRVVAESLIRHRRKAKFAVGQRQLAQIWQRVAGPKTELGSESGNN